MKFKVTKDIPIVNTDDSSVSGETVWNREDLVHISVFGLLKLPVLILVTTSEWAVIFHNAVKMILARWQCACLE